MTIPSRSNLYIFLKPEEIKLRQVFDAKISQDSGMMRGKDSTHLVLKCLEHKEIPVEIKYV
jgi:hypothetical protein